MRPSKQQVARNPSFEGNSPEESPGGLGFCCSVDYVEEDSYWCQQILDESRWVSRPQPKAAPQQGEIGPSAQKLKDRPGPGLSPAQISFKQNSTSNIGLGNGRF